MNDKDESMKNDSGLKRVKRRYAALLERLFGGSVAPYRRLLAGSALAAAMSVAHAQEAIPAHWIAYAQLTGNELQARLSEGTGDLISRLHAWLYKRHDQGGAHPVNVRIWISPQGWVEKTEFESLGDAQADADLRAILSARPLPEPPPPDMQQPMVLQLTLQSNPEYVGDGAASAGR